MNGREFSRITIPQLIVDKFKASHLKDLNQTQSIDAKMHSKHKINLPAIRLNDIRISSPITSPSFLSKSRQFFAPDFNPKTLVSKLNMSKGQVEEDKSSQETESPDEMVLDRRRRNQSLMTETTTASSSASDELSSDVDANNNSPPTALDRQKTPVITQQESNAIEDDYDDVFYTEDFSDEEHEKENNNCKIVTKTAREGESTGGHVVEVTNETKSMVDFRRIGTDLRHISDLFER